MEPSNQTGRKRLITKFVFSFLMTLGESKPCVCKMFELYCVLYKSVEDLVEQRFVKQTARVCLMSSIRSCLRARVY